MIIDVATARGVTTMPIYEFKCRTCDHVFEDLVPINTDGEGLTCPGCGAVGARRLVSAFAAHGLENGHIAVGRKFTGGGSKSSEGESSGPAEKVTKSACGPGCACH